MNPLYRPTPRIPRPRAITNGNMFSARTYFTNETVAASPFISATNIWLDAGSSSSVLSGWQSVVALYAEYLVQKCTLQWMPFVAPGVADAGTKCHVAFFTNPEQMTSLSAASAATRLTAIKQNRNSVSWNAWERFSYRIPLNNRRKKFDVNNTITRAEDTMDRSTQGLIAMAFEGITANAVIGQAITDVDVRLEGLTNTTT